MRNAREIVGIMGAIIGHEALAVPFCTSGTDPAQQHSPFLPIVRNNKPRKVTLSIYEMVLTVLQLNHCYIKISNKIFHKQSM